VDSEKLIDFAVTSPFGQGRPGRNARKNAAKNAAKEGEADDE
jgi:small subunit ribosomal protein S9e